MKQIIYICAFLLLTGSIKDQLSLSDEDIARYTIPLKNLNRKVFPGSHLVEMNTGIRQVLLDNQ